MVFHWVVRHVRWLARVPGSTQLFDALLLAWSCVFHRQRVAAMEALEAAALQIKGIRLGVHRFGGTEFRLRGRELGHVHGNGLLDVHCSRERGRELIEAGRAKPHHIFPQSGWVSFQLESPRDVASGLEVLRSAIAES